VIHFFFFFSPCSVFLRILTGNTKNGFIADKYIFFYCRAVSINAAELSFPYLSLLLLPCGVVIVVFFCYLMSGSVSEQEAQRIAAVTAYILLLCHQLVPGCKEFHQIKQLRRSEVGGWAVGCGEGSRGLGEMLRDFSNSAIAVFGFSWGITCVDSF
jgi:hypothetical protein